MDGDSETRDMSWGGFSHSNKAAATNHDAEGDSAHWQAVIAQADNQDRLKAKVVWHGMLEKNSGNVLQGFHNRFFLMTSHELTYCACVCSSASTAAYTIDVVSNTTAVAIIMIYHGFDPPPNLPTIGLPQGKRVRRLASAIRRRHPTLAPMP